MVLSTNIKIIFPSPTKMYLASWSSGADSDVLIIVKLATLRQSVIPVPISKVFLQFSLLYCSFLWPAAKGAVEKFSSARHSTVGITAMTKFLWKGRTGRDNRNMFYIRLQIKIDIRHESAKTRWILIEKKKLLTVMFQLFSVAKTFPSSTSYSSTSTRIEQKILPNVERSQHCSISKDWMCVTDTMLFVGACHCM